MDMDVTAKFRADISDMAAKMSALDKQMKGLGDAAGAASKTISEKFTAAGKTMTDAGKKMSLAITAPLAGIGIAAVKTSVDFEKSLSTMVGLVGLTNDEVESLRGTILQLAGSTAKAPQELADAMFVVTSAGLRGEAAVAALDQAARASAAGLGTTADIARSVAGAVNAYGAANLDAANATDVIVATARAGNFETSQFAASIGRVLPFAKQAGASLEDMGGAVALLTRTNGDAAQSVTQVASLFRAFVVPTEEAKKALEDVGMSAGTMRTAIAEQGLPAALTMLDKKLGGNREQLGRLLGSSEAASAAFQILDSDAASIAGTFGVVNDSVGMTGEAFNAAAETSGFKFQQAMVAIKTALIEIGDIISPIVVEIALRFKDLVTRFTELSPVVQTTAVVFGVFAAAAGPVLLISGQLVGATGKLIEAYKKMPAALNSVTASMKAMNAAFLTNPVVLVIAGIVAAVAALVIAFKTVYDRSEVLRKAVSDVVEVFKTVASTVIGEVVAAFSSLFGVQKKVGGGMEGFGDILQKVADIVGPILAGALQYVITYLKVVGNVLRVGVKGFEIFATIVKMVANVARVVFVAAFQKVTSVLSTLMDKLGPIGAAVKRVASAIGSAFSNIPALVSGAIRSAVGFVEGLINKAIGAINFLIRAYNKIPFVSGISEIAEFSFGSFESGAAAVNNLAGTMGGLESQMIKAGGVVDNVSKKQQKLNETLNEGAGGGAGGGGGGGGGKTEDPRAERIKKQTEALRENLNAAKAAYGAIKSLTESRFGEDSQILKAFGTEGDISSTIGMYDQLDAALNDYYSQLLKAPGLSKKVTKSLQAERDAQRGALKDAAQTQIDLFRQRAKIQKDLADLETSYAATTAGIGARFDALDKQADDAVKSIEARYAAMIPGLEKALSTATAAYEKENAVLQGLIGQRDSFLTGIQGGFRGFLNSLTFPLKKAQKAVKDALPAATMQRTIKDYANGLRVTIESEIAPAMEELSESIGEQALTAGDIRGALEERLAQIRSFATNIQTLMARGLDSSLVQEFVSAGVSGAGEAVAALVSASGEEISAINEMQSALAAEVASFGTFGAEQWYNAGIAQQEAIVAPLAIAAQQAQMALDMANSSRDSELASARAHAEQLKVDRQAAMNQARLDYEKQKTDLETQMTETNTAIQAGADELQTKFTALQQTLPPQMHRIGEASANMILKGFKNRYPNLSEKLNNMMTRLANEMRRETTITVTTVHRSVFEGGPTPPGRALGGPVQARQAYIVGERGPELFMSNQAGNIIPNNALRSPMPAMRGVGGGGGGNVTNVSINVQTGIATDPAETGRQVVEAIRKYERRSGPVFVSAG
jgi:TP901 family phage tail tape measure protein